MSEPNEDWLSVEADGLPGPEDVNCKILHRITCALKSGKEKGYECDIECQQTWIKEWDEYLYVDELIGDIIKCIIAGTDTIVLLLVVMKADFLSHK